jgi:hypothetical protein
MTDRFFITCFIVAASLLFIAGVSGVQCSLRPALINWERREKPIFPIRPKKKHAAPGGLQPEGEASRLHSGAAPISLPPVAAGKSNRPDAGRDAAGADL